MPSRGNNLHDYLKKQAIKRVADIFSGSIDFIRNEQPQNDDGNVEQNYFKVNISIGSGWHDDISAENMVFPDLVVQINLDDNERNDIEKKTGVSAQKKILVIECETTKAPWLTDKTDARHNSYRLIKDKHNDIVFVLVTFKDLKVSSDLFNEIWRFDRPEKK